MDQAETTIREGNHLRMTPPPRDWHIRAGLQFHEVETLLDGLEAAGIAHREIQLAIDGTFQVRWRAA